MSLRHGILIPVTAMIVATLGSCSAIAASNVPSHNLDGGPAAQLEEVSLARDGDCLILRGQGSEWLAIWPRGYRLDGDALMDGVNTIAVIGDGLRVTGGAFLS
jgi:hypothetical protein